MEESMKDNFINRLIGTWKDCWHGGSRFSTLKHLVKALKPLVRIAAKISAKIWKIRVILRYGINNDLL